MLSNRKKNYLKCSSHHKSLKVVRPLVKAPFEALFKSVQFEIGQPLTDYMNWMDVFIINTVPKKLLIENGPTSQTQPKITMAKYNLHLRRPYLSVDDAIQFHLLDLVKSPAFFPLSINCECRQLLTGSSLNRHSPLLLFPSLSFSFSLGLYKTLPQSRTSLFRHPYRLSHISKRPLASFLTDCTCAKTLLPERYACFLLHQTNLHACHNSAKKKVSQQLPATWDVLLSVLRKCLSFTLSSQWYFNWLYLIPLFILFSALIINYSIKRIKSFQRLVSSFMLIHVTIKK